MREELIRRVRDGLNRVAHRLEELGDPEAGRFRAWAQALQEGGSKALVESLWAAIQPMRAHMGYLDYADEAFNAAFDELFQSMEELVSEVRKADLSQNSKI